MILVNQRWLTWNTHRLVSTKTIVGFPNDRTLCPAEISLGHENDLLAFLIESQAMMQ